MKNLFILAMLFVVMVFAPPSQAATYYISPSGAGTTCSLAAPCSFTQALSYSKAGDNVIATDGTYTKSSGYIWTISGKNGTAEKPITIQALNPKKAILDARYVNNIALSINYSSYIVIDGFEIKRAKNDGIQISGINSSGTLTTSNHITVKNCEIHSQNSKFLGDCATGGVMCGVWTNPYTEYITFESNVIHDNGKAPGSCVMNSDPTSAASIASIDHLYRHDHGLYLQGKGHIVRKNTFYNHNNGWAIKLDGYCNATPLGSSERGFIVEGNRFNPEIRRYSTNSGGAIRFFVNQSSCPSGLGDPSNNNYYREPRNVLIKDNLFYYQQLSTGIDYLISITRSYQNTIFDGTEIIGNITTGASLYAGDSLNGNYANVIASITASGNIVNARESYFTSASPNSPSRLTLTGGSLKGGSF